MKNKNYTEPECEVSSTSGSFNLSENRNDFRLIGKFCYFEEDVKEFIKLLKEELINITAINKLEDRNEIINKLAGEKLT